MNISDGDFDKVLAGSGVSGPEAVELARVMRQLNSTYVSPILPATAAKHLQAIQKANAGRSAGGSKTAQVPGLLAGLEPLKAFSAACRRFGFVQLSGSTAVWAVVVALFLVSATGGLAAAGVLPDGVQSAVSNAAKTVGIEVPRREAIAPRAQPEDPSAAATVNVNPAEVAAQQAAIESAEQAIAAAEQAHQAAQEAAATSARCIEESMSQIASLVDGIAGATSQAQAQAVVTRARSIGSSVKACSDQAAAIGQSGVGYAVQAAHLAQRASENNPALSAQALTRVREAERAARAAEASANEALGVSRSVFDHVSVVTAGLVNSTVELQENLPAATPPTEPRPASPPAGQAAEPRARTNGADYSNRIMRSFMGGGGRRR